MNARQALAARALALVDLTDLGDHTTAEATAELCRRAVGPFGSTAAVCVWPRFVRQAAELLTGTDVRVATVVNFPAGGTDVDATVAETVGAIAAGAAEIDLVLPYHAFLAGDVEIAEIMIDAVRAVAAPPARLKVILETGEYRMLSDVTAASTLAIQHEADFIKTSTGKSATSATLTAAETMLTVIHELGRPVGLKPSGGIRTLADAADYLALADRIMGPDWASPATFRFGASGLLDALEAEMRDDGRDDGDADTSWTDPDASDGDY